MNSFKGPQCDYIDVWEPKEMRRNRHSGQSRAGVRHFPFQDGSFQVTVTRWGIDLQSAGLQRVRVLRDALGYL
jgi:hypothetical protein